MGISFYEISLEPDDDAKLVPLVMTAEDVDEENHTYGGIEFSFSAKNKSGKNLEFFMEKGEDVRRKFS